jgi:DNA modification methylase
MAGAKMKQSILNHKSKFPATGRSALSVTYRPIDNIRLDPGNPRSHSRRQIRQIANSIKAFGFNVPVLIDQEMKVIAGHGRLLACRELGWTEVPTIRLDHLSQAQARAFMIADNRLTETSCWDERLLAEQLKELSELDLDFSLETTGFEMGEIDLRIEGLDSGADPQDDPADVIPPTPKRPPVSRTGDLWLLGRHRLCCGSALDRGAYDVLMDGERAAIVFTDPPYNVPIDGHASGLGAIRHRDFVMASGEMIEGEFTAFLTKACQLLASNSADGAIHFLCMDWRHLGELLAAGKEAYSELKNICVWVKHNAGMGSFFRSQHELVCVFKHGRGPHRNNVQLGQYGRHRSNVWSYPGVNSFGRTTDEGNLLALHPTVKPVALVADAILDCSARGDIVLDPFLGSGTTVMAAERVGRRCYGIELDPIYVDTTILRWQAFTGAAARQAVTGRAFNELATEKEIHNAE